MIKIFGSSTIVISIEAKRKDINEWEVYIDNGREKTGLDVEEWTEKVTKLKAGEILITSVDNEGTRKGFDLPLLKKVRSKTNLPLIACGGMSSPNDLAKAFSEC